jgi:acetyl/propionyl-CoA carboxylase alpha subunit
MIRRVLIANRGEIARRVIRTCRTMAIDTVAVYSDADRTAPHVEEADAAVRLGPAPALESYLDIGRVIEAAAASGADAVHPGYGFLSENPAFAKACEAAGLIFIGPPSAVMRRMGSKTGARTLVAEAGVPVVPGAIPGSQSDAEVAAAVAEVGVPALIKAASGGGGTGMRIVRAGDDVHAAIAAARQESARAFGRDALYVEHLVEHARHIEVQIVADRHGHVVHLGERDCTLQRRHQKVIEETPAPAIAPALRARLTEAAIAVARASGYVNAGTVEFLVEGRGDAARCYFLEMNMRLQVEHPITEAVTGIDLVRTQLLVASGEPLPFTQESVTPRGHAIECRVYAEDPRRLLPQVGRLIRYREPQGDGIRVDAGVVEGSAVTVHYDPLLAKVIVHAATREEALARMRSALGAYEILGLHHNRAFLRALLARPEVAAADVTTRFVEAHLDELAVPAPAAERRAALAIPAVRAAGPDAVRSAIAPAVGAMADVAAPAGAAGEAGRAGRCDPWDALGAIAW